MGAELDRLEVVIEAQVSKANIGLDKLASKLNKVSASLGKMNTGSLSKMARNVSSATKQSQGTLSKLSASFSVLEGSSARASKRSMHSFSQWAGSFYANSFIVIRGLKKLGSAIEKSMDYVETFNYYKVINDKVAKEFPSAWAENGKASAEAYERSFRGTLDKLTEKMTGYKVLESGELISTDGIGLGLDPEAIMDFQAQIMSITNSVGLIGEISTNTSDALTRLAADMSSLKNEDLTTVMNNLRSGLIGQSRALYKYGIDITNTNLQEYALAAGIKKKVSEMNQAEKMQLRLVAIMDQSKVAWGDMANTIGGVANQYRVFKQQISNLARELGNIFLPVLGKILPFLNAVVIAIQRLVKWIGGLLGIKWGDISDGISSGYSGAGLDAMADSAGDAEDALTGAGKAAKKLKNATLGIDELNINSPSDSASGAGGTGGGGGGGVDLSGDIAGLLGEYQAVWDAAFADMENKMQKWLDNIVGWAKSAWQAIEPFREAVKRLWDEGLSKFANFTWTALKDFYNEFLVPIGLWAFGTEGAGLTRLVDIINNSLLAINWERLNSSLKNFWKAIEPYAEQFGEGLIDFFEDVAGLAVDIINKFPDVLDGITEALNKGDPESARKWGYAFGALGAGVLVLSGIGTIVGGIAGFGNALIGLSTGLGAVFGSSGVLATIGGVISSFFSIFASGGVVYESIGMLGINLSILVEGLTGIAVPIGASMAAIVVAIVAVVAALVDLWNTSETFRGSVSLAFSMVKDSLVNAFQKIQEAVAPLWEKIKELGASLYDLYEATLKPIIEPIASFAAILLGIAASTAIEIISSAIAGLCEILGGAIDIIAGVADILTGLATLDLSKIGEGFSGIFSGISQIGDGAKELFVGWIDDAFGNISGKIQEVIEHICNSASAWWQENMAPFFEGIAEWFSSIGTSITEWWNGSIIPAFENISAKFSSIWNRICGFFLNAWDKIKQIWSSVSSWFTANIIEPIVSSFVGLAQKVSQTFQDLWSAIQSVWKSASTWFSAAVIEPLASFFTELSETISRIFEGVWLIIQAVWIVASDWFKQNVVEPIVSFFTGLYNRVSEIFGALWTKVQEIWSVVSEWFNLNIIQPVVSLFTAFKENVHKLFDMLWTGIKAIWSMVFNWFNTKVIIPVRTAFDTFCQKMRQFFSDLWENIKTIWSVVYKWYVDNIITPVREAFDTFCTNINQFFSDLWEGIKGVWKQAPGWFTDNIITPVTEAFENLKENITSAFTNAWEAVKKGVVSAMNAVISVIEKALNKVIGSINEFLSGFNAIADIAGQITGNDWSHIGKLSEVRLGRIEMYASGGFPNTGELFMARENGITEMVGSMGNRSAVANNDQIVTGIAYGVSTANEPVVNAINELSGLITALTQVVAEKELYIGDKDIARAASRGQSKIGYSF